MEVNTQVRTNMKSSTKRRVERQMKGSQNHVNVHLKHKKEYLPSQQRPPQVPITQENLLGTLKIPNQNLSSVLETSILNNNDFFNITFLILVLGLFYYPFSHFLNWEFKIFHFSPSSFHCIHT